jgi:DNA adenine methylase
VFHGLFRVNKKGDFNAAWGHYKDPKFCNEEAILAASKAFQHAVIRLEGYEAVADRAEAGDLVYFDPPYLPLTESADFTEYTLDGFSLKQHYELRDLFAELAKNDVKAILSNSDTPQSRVLYKDFQIHTVQAARVINRVASKRGKVSEIMVTNWTL